MKKIKSKSKIPQFADVFKPVSMLIATDVILGNDGLVSIIKLMDKVNATGFPITIYKIMIVGEFDRNMNFSVDDISRLEPRLALTVINPAGEEVEFGETDVSMVNRSEWTIQRTIFDISGVSLKNKGRYLFKLYGSLKGSSKEEMLSRALALEHVHNS